MKNKKPLICLLFFASSDDGIGQKRKQNINRVNVFTRTSNFCCMPGLYAGVSYGMMQL